MYVYIISFKKNKFVNIPRFAKSINIFFHEQFSICGTKSG